MLGTVQQSVLKGKKMVMSHLNVLGKLGFPWGFPNMPGFQVSGKQVEVITHPEAFYKTLLNKCKTAERRIVLASLYLGTGPLEAGLVATIQKRLTERNNLQVSILLDCMRGSRGKEETSRTMLLPLLKNHSKSCQVNLYHTPKLRGLLKKVLPARYNEIVGLQHMKLYIFDDDLIITGANLSQDYFTNRQDRYMVVSNCRPLADFAAGLCEKVADFSFRLNANNKLQMSSSWSSQFANSNSKNFIDKAREHVWSFYVDTYNKIGNEPTPKDADTVIYPLLEMGQLGLHQESHITQKLLENCPKDSEVKIATGYFNLTNEYANSIVNSSGGRFKLLMAHPTANGFYEAQGPAGGIPKGYSELAGKVFDLVKLKKQDNRIYFMEYARKGWTFHAKGLWLALSENEPPNVTLIGSSNFGERSVHRDLECQFLISTSNPSLQDSLKRESTALYYYVTPYSTAERSRNPPTWVRIVISLFKDCL